MALLGDGVLIAGGTTSMSDLDEVMVFAVVELAASEKVETNSYPKPIESVVASDDFTKTGA